MAWPICFACGWRGVPEKDSEGEIFNKHEAVVVRSYRCVNPECPRDANGKPWSCWTAEKVIEERPPKLYFRRRRWHIRLIDHVAALFAQPAGRR